MVKSILDEEDILPDSIIKHLCSDKQFEKCNADELGFMMNIIFMYNGYMGYEDYSCMIKKILKNDLSNWNEEAVFYDLRKLYDIVYDIHHNPKSEYDVEEILSDIKCDALYFDEVREDSYGSI